MVDGVHTKHVQTTITRLPIACTVPSEAAFSDVL